MKYNSSITINKFFVQMGYGVAAFLLTFIVDFMVTIPPEVMTLELVVIMGAVRALDNYFKHKRD